MTTPVSSTPAARPFVPASATPTLGGGGGDGGLRKAAEQFEAVILRQLLASMRQAKLGDDMMGSSATDNFREMADAINAAIPGSASMIDGASIAIRSGGNGDDRMRLMSQIENLGVQRSEPSAKVIVNARTGTVVINGAVRVGTAAVSHGKLTVSIKESPTVVQPAPFSRGETAIEPSSEIEVAEDVRPAFLMKPNASLSELVDSINRLGVSPGDLVAILEALSQAGALTAELVII